MADGPITSIHLCTAEVLTTLGTEHAVLSPNAHLRTFIWADLLAGLLQAIGLGVTFSHAKQAGPWGITLPAQAGPGQAVIYAGLLLQTLALAAALSLLAVAYVRAGRADRKYGYTAYVPLGPKFKTFLAVLPLAGVCTLVRCAYRTAAVWGGLGSATARDEVLWLVAEGVMLTEAMASLAIFHPAIWLDDGAGGRSARNRNNNNDVEQGGTGAAATSKLSKRLTGGTFMTELDMDMDLDLDVDVDMDERRRRDSRQDLEEVGRGGLLATNLIAPSDVSSHGSTSGSASRRGSAGEREQLYPASPYDSEPREGVRRYSEDITSESRGMSPLEAEAEQHRLEAESFIEPPRKSSKRMSRVLQQQREEAEREAREREEAEREAEDRLEVGSIMLPSRKPSRRDTVRRDDEMEDVALTSTYSQSVYSQ